MQPYRKWQRYLRVGIRAIGTWLLSIEKKIIIGRSRQAVESYGADMHCETAPPCSSFQLSVFVMFWLTCECREDRLLFKTWNEHTLLVIGKRGRSVTPSKRGPSCCHGARETAERRALWNHWDSAGGWVTQMRAAGETAGKIWEPGFSSLFRFIDFKLQRSPPTGALSSTSPPVPLYLDQIQSPANVGLSYRAGLEVLRYLWKSVCFNRCTYNTFPVDFTF